MLPLIFCSPYKLTIAVQKDPCNEQVGAGPTGLPNVFLRHPTGYSAEVSLHGATVTALRRGDGGNILYQEPDGPLDGVNPIRSVLKLIYA